MSTPILRKSSVNGKLMASQNKRTSIPNRVSFKSSDDKIISLFEKCRTRLKTDPDDLETIGEINQCLTDLNRMIKNGKTSPQLLLVWIGQMLRTYRDLMSKGKGHPDVIFRFILIPFHISTEEVDLKFKQFVVNFCCNYDPLLELVLKELFNLLVPKSTIGEIENASMNAYGDATHEEIVGYKRIAGTIKRVVDAMPLALCGKFVLKNVHQTIMWRCGNTRLLIIATRNMLMLAEKLPLLRQGILDAVLRKAVEIDLRCPRTNLKALCGIYESEGFELAMDEDSEDENNDEFECEDRDKEDNDSSDSDTDSHMSNDAEDLGDHGPILSTRDQQVEQDGIQMDIVMTVMLEYIHSCCHGWQDTWLPVPDDCCKFAEPPSGSKGGECQCRGIHHNTEEVTALYKVFLKVFDDGVFFCGVSHVPYVPFYLLGLRPSLTEDFLGFLLEVLQTAGTDKNRRRYAAGYVGSLVARGNFVTRKLMRMVVEQMCQWCFSYLREKELSHNMVEAKLQLHPSFYYSCETIFYILTFRYKDYENSSKRHAWVTSLDLTRLVNCPLNPLRFCSTKLMHNFCDVMNYFQIVPCQHIIAKNAACRSVSFRDEAGITLAAVLNMLVPFDCYCLPRSNGAIKTLIRRFPGMPAGSQTGVTVSVPEKAWKGAQRHEGEEMEMDEMSHICGSLESTRLLHMSLESMM